MKFFLSSSGTVVRALASHQCVPGLIPRPGVTCGLSLLLVLSSAPKGFSSGTPGFPSPQKLTFPNSNFIWIIVKHFNMSLCLGRSCKHSLCLTLNLHLHLRLHNPSTILCINIVMRFSKFITILGGKNIAFLGFNMS